MKAVTSITSEQSNNLIVQLSHPDAIIPKQASTKAAGYDLYSIQTRTIKPNCEVRINTGIKIQLPMHIYGRIASRSGLVVNHCVHTEGGVIDPDITGKLQVILHNFGTMEYTVTAGDRIAQLILERFESPAIVTTDNIHHTERGEHGFGSTGVNSMATVNSMRTIQACDLTVSLYEPMDIIDITMMVDKTHPTLGLNLDKKLKVLSYILGTSAAKIKGLRQTIKNTILYSINGIEVTTLTDV